MILACRFPASVNTAGLMRSFPMLGSLRFTFSLFSFSVFPLESCMWRVGRFGFRKFGFLEFMLCFQYL